MHALKINQSHWIGRPPANAQRVERWTGKQWILDDGRPGLAFSGVVFDGDPKCEIPTPIAWTSGCECHLISASGCPSSIAAQYTAKRFGCSNGDRMTRLHLRLVANYKKVSRNHHGK